MCHTRGLFLWILQCYKTVVVIHKMVEVLVKGPEHYS